MGDFTHLIQEQELKKIVDSSISQLLSEYGVAGYHYPNQKLLEEDDPEQPGKKEPSPQQTEPKEQEPIEPQAKKSVKISSDMAMSLLNDIRSGKSVKNVNIKKEFVAYFNNLKPPARTALIGFLEGLKDIMVAGEPAAIADDPSDDITMEPTKKSTEPLESPESETDETPPIKVGEPQTEAAKKRLMIS
jgi:hypothetical protein